MALNELQAAHRRIYTLLDKLKMSDKKQELWRALIQISDEMEGIDENIRNTRKFADYISGYVERADRNLKETKSIFFL